MSEPSNEQLHPFSGVGTNDGYSFSIPQIPNKDVYLNSL
jgi:hypothetical protein